MPGSPPSLSLSTAPIDINAMVKRLNTNVEITVPTTANITIDPKFSKNDRFFILNPAENTIGGSSPYKNAVGENLGGDKPSHIKFSIPDTTWNLPYCRMN